MSILKPLLSSPINSSKPLSLGLVHCWSFSEGGGRFAVNSANNTKENSILGNITYQSSIRGVTVNSDGTDGRVSIGSLNLGTTHTLSFWFRGDTFGTGNAAGGSDSGGGRVDYAGYIDNSTGTGSVYYRNGFTSPSNPAVKVHGGLSGWTHFALTRNNTTTVTFYKNGLSLGTATTTGNGVIIFTSLIGNFIGTSALDGDIDIILLYNRQLSPTEIRQLYINSYQMFK